MGTTITSKNKIALASVCLSAAMLGLEITSIPSILPTLESVLPADFRQLQWIMNAYTIAMCSMLVAMGSLADRFGRKRVFSIGITVFAIASLICGLAINAPLLIAARFVQGASAAAMLACQVAVLSHQFRDGPERGVAFALWGVVFGLGLGFGPVVGGAIVALMSWHWVFLIHVVIGILTLVFACIGVTESSDPHARRIDFGGMITLSIAVFGLVYLITQASADGGSDGANLLIAGASAIAALLFVIIERRVARPMFDFGAFRVRNFSGALAGAAGMNFSFWPFVIYLPIYLQSVLGHSSIEAGLIVLAYTLPTIAMPPIAERLLLSRGPKFVIPLGLFTIGAGFAAIHLVVASQYANWLSLLPGLLLAGAGLGLTNTPVTNTATGSLPPERAGMASGMEFSARMISLALNIALMGFVLLAAIANRLRVNATSPETDQLRDNLASIIAAGNLQAAEAHGITAALARDMLAYGFGWVTLYGALAPIILGAAAMLLCVPRRHIPATGMPEQTTTKGLAADTDPAPASAD